VLFRCIINKIVKLAHLQLKILVFAMPESGLEINNFLVWQKAIAQTPIEFFHRVVKK
jgi:hypothetical protein